MDSITGAGGNATAQKAWSRFVAQTGSSPALQGQPTGFREGIWLLPADSDFQGFADLVHRFGKEGVSFQVILIDGELQWLHEPMPQLHMITKSS